MRGGRKKWSWSLQSPGSRAGGAELVCTLSPTSWSDKRQTLDGGDRRSDNDSLELHERHTFTALIRAYAHTDTHTNKDHNKNTHQEGLRLLPAR